MRILFVLVLFFWAQAVVAADTFIAQTQANFIVTEKIDGTVTTATKAGPLNVTLTTDYSSMRWSIDFNVDLLMAGGPDRPFETRLLASGSLSSNSCASTCDIYYAYDKYSVTHTFALSELGRASVLSFPDANGVSGAGSYVLFGQAEWTLSDRIVTSLQEWDSPEQTVLGSGSVTSVIANPGVYPSYSKVVANNPGSHYLSFLDYPNNVQLTPGVTNSSATNQDGNQPGEWVSSNSGTLNLGDYGGVEVTVSDFPSTITLSKLLPGDFNRSGTVDAADYAVWRKGLGSDYTNEDYDVWRSNFGNASNSVSGGELATTVPEPVSLVMFLIGTMAAAFKRNFGRCQ